MGYEHEDYGVPVELIKPYLRPLFSMTEEEKRELMILWNEDFVGTKDTSYIYPCYTKTTAFYQSHHFDYMGLIPRGLAIEAGKEIYEK